MSAIVSGSKRRRSADATIDILVPLNPRAYLLPVGWSAMGIGRWLTRQCGRRDAIGARRTRPLRCLRTRRKISGMVRSPVGEASRLLEPGPSESPGSLSRNNCPRVAVRLGRSEFAMMCRLGCICSFCGRIVREWPRGGLVSLRGTHHACPLCGGPVQRYLWTLGPSLPSQVSAQRARCT